MIKKTTLNDIAELAGVNPSTVSRALNKASAGMISDKQQQKILGIANNLHYRPSSSARSFASRKNFKIGLILGAIEHDLTSPPFALFVRELCGGLQQHGYLLLLLWASGKDQSKDDEVINFLMSNSADGYILGSSLISQKVTDSLKKTKVPIITLFSPQSLQATQFTSVKISIEQAYADALQSVPQQYGDKILYVGVEGQSTAVKFKSLSSIACKLYPNYTIDKLFYRTPGCNFMFDRTFACEMAKSKLGKLREYKIIFCASDLTALGVRDALREAGVEADKDICIVGYDNIEDFAGFNVSSSLSTIDPNMHLLGRQSAVLILEKIDNPANVIKEILIPATFIRRNSFPQNKPQKKETGK